MLRTFAISALAVSAIVLLAGPCFAGIVDGSLIDMSRSTNGYNGGLANVVNGDYGDKDRTWGGLAGEFRVTELKTPGGSNVSASAAQVFKTFCLEKREFISLGGDYKVSIDGGAILGGNTGGPYDAPSGATQWFYGAYRSNVLDTFTGSVFQYDNAEWADALQLFFWRQEGEVNGLWRDTVTNSLTGSTTTRGYADQLWNIYTQYQVFLDSYIDPRVRVMNLWSADTTLNLSMMDDPAYRALKQTKIANDRKQSQLFFDGLPGNIPPMPEPASCLIWAGGLGIAGIAGRRSLSKRR